MAGDNFVPFSDFLLELLIIVFVLHQFVQDVAHILLRGSFHLLLHLQLILELHDLQFHVAHDDFILSVGLDFIEAFALDNGCVEVSNELLGLSEDLLNLLLCLHRDVYSLGFLIDGLSELIASLPFLNIR